MGFIDSYKRLEKLCGEVMNDEKRLSAYIDEMKKTPNGYKLVAGWEDDLEQLKHYRWIRNQIAHELDCREENMCEPNDALWLDHFYSRIMNQTDPLALYAKAIKPRTESNPQGKITQTDTYSTQCAYHQPDDNDKRTLRKPFGWGIFAIVILAIIVVVILICDNIWF